MSERLLLEALREDAERRTRLPAFELIEAAGRARRRRRHAIGGVVAACLLTVTGFLATTTGDTPDPQPADPAPRSEVTPWPGPTMTTVEEGTYEFRVAVAPDNPPVRVTLPEGWNAWRGPNRFEGLGRIVTDDPDVNEGVLAKDPRWGAGLLVLDVRWVAQRDCTVAETSDSDAAAVARALARMPGFRVDMGPTRATLDGHPALHLNFRGVGTAPACNSDDVLLSSQGLVGGGGTGSMYDVWVIDTGVSPVVVWAEWSRGTPQRDVEDLLGMVESVEIGD